MALIIGILKWWHRQEIHWLEAEMHRIIRLEAMITNRDKKLEKLTGKTTTSLRRCEYWAKPEHEQDITTEQNHDNHLLWLNGQHTHQP